MDFNFVFVIIYVALHVFNFASATMSTYVHKVLTIIMLFVMKSRIQAGLISHESPFWC